MSFERPRVIQRARAELPRKNSVNHVYQNDTAIVGKQSKLLSTHNIS